MADGIAFSRRSHYGEVCSLHLLIGKIILKLAEFLQSSIENLQLLKGKGKTMRSLFVILLSIIFVSPVLAGDGLINVKSAHDVKQTTNRLESVLKEKGMTVFIRIDHAQGAKKVGKDLRSTELVIFGNPKVGTPLIQCAQSVAIDLPQKALIWKDDAGQVWLSYNDPKYLKKRHGIKGCDEVIGKVEKALGNFAKKATMP